MSLGQIELPIKIKEEKSEQKATSFSGLVMYIDLMVKMGLWEIIKKNVNVKSIGWTEMELIISLILLNIAGGTSVSDINRLERDAGLRRLLKDKRMLGLTKKVREELKKRWRQITGRTFPSVSAILNFLKRFHSAEEEERRFHTNDIKAFIPRNTPGLDGLNQVNKSILELAQKYEKEQTATLDMDATVIESHKRTAKNTYKKFPGYQPFNVLWNERNLLVYSEFRDGNVPAGYEQLRVLKNSLKNLPEGVKKVRLRSDTAGYQHELMKYCETKENERFGRIEFAISCDVTKWFKQAAAEVNEKEWHRLYKKFDKQKIATEQEWAEVVYVPNKIAYSKKAPSYRYIAIRQLIRQQELALEEKEPKSEFHEVKMGEDKYKVFGIVTNMDWDGEVLINWQRKRAGKGEAMQGVLKSDLAGGTMPAEEFGSNAAWWAIVVLAFNINEIMKRLILPNSWWKTRMKGIRFAFINVAARILYKARTFILKVGSSDDVRLFLRAREKIKLFYNLLV